MLGLWLFPFLSIFSAGDSLTISSVPIKEVNVYRTQYFPIYSAARQELFLTVRKGTKSDEEIFVSAWNGKQFEIPRPIEELNQENNEGTPTLSKDGLHLIFSGCDYPNSFGGCDLYECTWVDGSWTRPKNLGFLVNSHDWEGQPQLNSDGSKLFFSSDRPGGEGKRDIWLTERGTDGKWGIPKNLGKKINSSEDEQGPYYMDERAILVFSTNQKGGKGGLDFHQSLWDGKIWSESVAIKEINSTSNDAGFSEGIHENQYYISRKVNDSIQDIQIQSVEIPEFCWLKKPVDLPPPILVAKPAPIEFQKLHFEDIQFENNKSDLPFVTPACLLDLVSYLFQNPTKSIEIHGHTDEVGNAQSNLSLSDRRANSVKKYLMDQGIAGERIKTIAFGNSKPKIKAKTAEARKINRRIEIILP